MHERILELWSSFPGTGNGLFVFDAQGAPVGDVSAVTMWCAKGAERLGAACGLETTPDLVLAALCAAVAVLTALTVFGWSLTFHGRPREAFISMLIPATTYGVVTAFVGDVQTSLFTLLTLGAVLVLHSGYSAPFAPLRLTLGFVLAALATMTGGLLGMIVPLLTSLLSVLWRGNWRRIGSMDGVIGFAVAVAALAVWTAILVLHDTAHVVSAPLGNFMIRSFGLPGSTDVPPMQTAAAFGLATAPWTVLLLCLPYERIKVLPAEVLEARTSRPGSALPYIVMLVCAACLSFAWNGAALLCPLAVAAYAVPASAILTGMTRKRLAIVGIALAALAVAGLIAFWTMATPDPKALQDAAEAAEGVRPDMDAMAQGRWDAIKDTIADWIGRLTSMVK